MGKKLKKDFKERHKASLEKEILHSETSIIPEESKLKDADDYRGKIVHEKDKFQDKVHKKISKAGTAQALERARERLGLPYDYSFRPDNGKLYCSELVWECYSRPDGSPRFPARPMNFRAPDGSMPAFWTELFERLGKQIPEGVPGTNPNDMARDPQLDEVGRWF